jgi:hypothetical protein
MTLMKVKLPWWNLGCLGFVFEDRYVDFWYEFGVWHMFVRRDFGNTGVTRDKSWYRLTWRSGVELTKREDRWGSWHEGLYGGRRKPPLMEYPLDGMLERALSYRANFTPYKIIDWYGERREVISFPFPHEDTSKPSIRVMMRRTPGDPTSMIEEILEEYL